MALATFFPIQRATTADGMNVTFLQFDRINIDVNGFAGRILPQCKYEKY